MAEGFNWKEFLRITGGVFLIGLGLGIAGTLFSNFAALVLGLVSVGAGIALLFME